MDQNGLSRAKSQTSDHRLPCRTASEWDGRSLHEGHIARLSRDDAGRHAFVVCVAPVGVPEDLWSVVDFVPWHEVRDARTGCFDHSCGVIADHHRRGQLGPVPVGSQFGIDGIRPGRHHPHQQVTGARLWTIQLT